MAPLYCQVTILGCGSSPGCPRPTGDWGNCDPLEPKNKRLRPALLIEAYNEKGAKTTVIIDTGPDFRQQMIKSKVRKIDAVLYTHGHADHTHGIDDLRSFCLDQKQKIMVYADKATFERLYTSFAYCFKTPSGSSYPPILSAKEITANQSFRLSGPGGELEFLPILQQHGAITSLGFRLGPLAYCTDVSYLPEDSLAKLQGVEVLIIDCLQYKNHPSHLSLEQALAYIDKLKVKRAILTHMHIAFDYATLSSATPDHVEPAYDGLSFKLML